LGLLPATGMGFMAGSDTVGLRNNFQFYHFHSLSGGQMLDAPLPVPCSCPSPLNSAFAWRDLMKWGAWVWAWKAASSS